MGHKWHALNMAGAQAPEEGYLAEHMSVARLTTPAGARHHLAAAFPSGSGKTQLATLASTLPGWRVELVADGMCFLRVGDDGRLWALNPTSGIDGSLTRGNGAMPPRRDVIFSDVALQRDGTPWWEGCGRPARPNMVT
jgi:phosphoenolpyruvate carboxykinase (GTP)